MANKKEKEEIAQIKNSLLANEDILKKHPNMEESILAENSKLKTRLAELTEQDEEE